MKHKLHDIFFQNRRSGPGENKSFPYFAQIRKSIKLAFNALEPGIKGIEIDKIARDYIVSRGYKEYPHVLGHQVGRSAHDGSALLAPDWERYGNYCSLMHQGNLTGICTGLMN